MSARTRLFRTVFAALHATGANRLLRPLAQGRGVILTLHHVRPWRGGAFAPNRLLEVTPDFLDETLTLARALGLEFVTLDEAVARLRPGASRRPFVHLTFDDGYRDVRDNALPILKRHGAPATLYVASNYAEGDEEIWWLALEQAIARAETLRVDLGAGPVTLPARTAAEKAAAWSKIYWCLRGGPEEALRSEVRRLAMEQGVDPKSFARELCMRWDELAEVAKEPLIEIGAHTMSHPMLAKHPRETALAEMDGGRAAIAEKLGTAPRHFAYPVGDRSAAGPRDYALAAELGFATAVTTRPGHLRAAHADLLTALPRVSLNGNFQTRGAAEALLTGAPFLATCAVERLRGSA